MLGGAYGAFVQFDDSTGVLTLPSYRDPNITATIKNYDDAAAFLKGLWMLRVFRTTD